MTPCYQPVDAAWPSNGMEELAVLEIKAASTIHLVHTGVQISRLIHRGSVPSDWVRSEISNQQQNFPTNNDLCVVPSDKEGGFALLSKSQFFEKAPFCV